MNSLVDYLRRQYETTIVTRDGYKLSTYRPPGPTYDEIDDWGHQHQYWKNL